MKLKEEQTQTLHFDGEWRRKDGEGWCPALPVPGCWPSLWDSPPPQRSLESSSPLTCFNSHLAHPLRGLVLPVQLTTLLPTQYRPQKPFPGSTQTPSPPLTLHFWVRTGCRTSGSGKAPTLPSGSHARLPLGSHRLHEKPRPAIQAHQLLGEMSIITAVFVDPADRHFFCPKYATGTKHRAWSGALRRLGSPPPLLSRAVEGNMPLCLHFLIYSR